MYLPFVLSFSLEIILQRTSHNMNLSTFGGMSLFSQFPFLDFLDQFPFLDFLDSVINFVLVDTTGLVSFWDKVSLYKPGWSGNCYVDYGVLELFSFLSARVKDKYYDAQKLVFFHRLI